MDNIIAKYFANQLSSKEKESLQKWIAESVENKKVFEDYKAVWEKSKSDKKEPIFEIEEALLKVNSIIKDKKKNRIGVKQVLMIAASLVILFGVYFFGFQNNKNSQFAYAEVKNETDSAILVDLPDRSKVWLKSGSSIEFEENFSDSLRKVVLEGTAYFEVEHNSAKAFVVECEETEIRVLGTKFNVETNEASVKTNLLEGKIKFYESKRSKNAIILEPNEIGVFNTDNSKISKLKFKGNNCLVWKTGILEYDNVIFTQVINELANYYGKEIEITNKKLKNYSFSGSFDNKSFEQVLNILEISLSVQIIEKDDRILIN